jgi:hypothetical protein
MWYIYTIEFYSAMKKNEIMLFAGKWIKLENFMLSEVSQAQKVKGYVSFHMWKLDLKLNVYTETQMIIYIINTQFCCCSLSIVYICISEIV